MLAQKSWYDSDEWLRDQLTILQVKSRIDTGKLADIAGMSRASYYARLKNPEEFKLKELRRLDKLAQRYGLSMFAE